MKVKNDDESSLSHTRWDCQYHIVFTPKYRRKAIFGKIRSDIGKYLRRLCEYKGVEIVEANACSDHIHMLIKVPPKISISSLMGYLKGPPLQLEDQIVLNLIYWPLYWHKPSFSVVFSIFVPKLYLKKELVPILLTLNGYFLQTICFQLYII